MTQPLCVIEHFVRLFLGQWHCGLQPNLRFKTDSNGTISVDFDVTTTLPTPVIEDDEDKRHNRRSGRGARSRRRKRRSQASIVHPHVLKKI